MNSFGTTRLSPPDPPPVPPVPISAEFEVVQSIVTIVFDQEIALAPFDRTAFTFRANNVLRDWSVDPLFLGNILRGLTTINTGQVGPDIAIYTGDGLALFGVNGLPVANFGIIMTIIPP